MLFQKSLEMYFSRELAICPKGCHVGDSVIDHSTLVAWPAQILYDELQEWSNHG